MTFFMRRVVLVTGSQLWKDRNVIYEVLEENLEEIESDEGVGMELHHGKSRGADTIADDWAYEKNKETPGRIKVVEFPANWQNCSHACGSKYDTHKKRNSIGILYCPTAGYRRNAYMVSFGAWRCLAFILDCSRGSTHCAELADKYGIPVVPYRQGRLPADSAR